MPIDENNNWYPGFLDKIVNGTIGYVKWMSDGCKHRHPDETKALFDEHCLGGDGDPCEEYEPDSHILDLEILSPPGICKKCGCHVSGDPKHLANKVNKPTAGCPLQKWLATVDAPDDD